MTELDIELTSIYTEMENFLRAQARKEPASTQSIYLKAEYKNGLRLIDNDKRQYNVEETYLSAFRDTYTDKAFKAIRIQNWEFEFTFTGKKCNKISLIANYVVFIANKTTKKQIDGCHFKFNIIENEAEVRKLSPEMNGYLNRIGKRHLCSQSYNVAKEMKSLLSFIKFNYHASPQFNYNPWCPIYKGDRQKIDPLSTLNPDGKKVLEKLRHFITRQNIANFLINLEASQENTQALRRIVQGHQE